MSAVCYPIVAETPSGRLRYKTVSIGRFVYNLTGIFQNSLTPRMVNSGNGAWGWGAKTALFYAGTNLACNIWCWFRLPETKDRSFGEIDIMFDNRVPARKFKYTRVDRKSSNKLKLIWTLADMCWQNSLSRLPRQAARLETIPRRRMVRLSQSVCPYSLLTVSGKKISCRSRYSSVCGRSMSASLSTLMHENLNTI